MSLTTLKTLRSASVATVFGATLIFSGCSKSDAPKDTPASPAARAESSNSEIANKEALLQLIAEFRAAVDAKDYDRVVEISMPPKFLGYFAEMAGTEPGEMRTAVVSQMGAIMGQVQSFDYAYDEDNIRFETLPDGTVFARMPLDVTMVMAGKTIKAKDHNIGLKENGKWYLVRVSEPELARMFKEAYPEFKDTEFAQQQMVNAE